MNKKFPYSDEDLVGMAQQGDKSAYNLLFKRYHNKIEQVIFFHINDRAHVNDLAQEVLLKIYRYLPSFKEKSLFSTWLYRITHNTIKNYYRTLSTRIDCESDFTDNQYQAIHQSPEYLLINFELCEQLNLAFSMLSDELRVCYLMHLFEGQTYEHIAKKIACPIGTVRSRIFRAKKILMSSIAHLI